MPAIKRVPVVAPAPRSPDLAPHILGGTTMRLTGLIGLLTLPLLLGPVAAGEKDKLDPAKLLGTWSYVSGEADGKKISGDDLKKGTVEFTKDTVTLSSPEGKFVIKYKVDADKSPAHIKMEILEGPQGKGAKSEGIIEFKGEQLVLCYPAMGGATPKTFETKKDSGLHLFTLKKKK
jgi:uncharacterized protein (TIGR03067 family)